jgi:hypothetical protein
MWKPLSCQLDSVGITINPNTIRWLNRRQKVSAFTTNVQDPAVRANNVFVNPVKPFVIIRITFTPAEQVAVYFGLV